MIKEDYIYNKKDKMYIRAWKVFNAYKQVFYIYIYIYIQGSLNKFPDFFPMGTFIDSTHIKL